MVGTLDYRPLVPADSEQMVAVYRAAFAPEVVAHTTYAGAGIGRYLGTLLAPHAHREHAFYGAWDGARLVGYTHGRALAGCWHLNQIAVMPAYQERGIGRVLWADWVSAGQQRGYTTLSLDVSAAQQTARAWYTRRGFQVRATSWLYQRPLVSLDPGLAQAACVVEGWTEAEAWQYAFGFSQFCLASDGEHWTVGRLGERYFRVTQPLPPHIEAVLQALDPRRALQLNLAEPLLGAEPLLVDTTLRLEGTWEG